MIYNALVTFDISVHCRILEATLPTQGYSADSVRLACEVQYPADKQVVGFKRSSLYWMHYIRQTFGMHAEDCDYVRKILGKRKESRQCTPDEAYTAGEKITFGQIDRLIRQSPPETLLTDETVGKSLFLLACLAHAVQDKKHMEGFPDGITALEHYLPPGWINKETDSRPPPAMEAGGRERTVALLGRFEVFLQRRFGRERGMELARQIKSFRLPPNKELADYIDPTLLPYFRDHNPSLSEFGM